MNALSKAQAGYAAGEVQTRTAKSLEYKAVATITRRIRDAAASGAPGFPMLAKALHDNRRLWGIFAAEVASPANPLPPELRARIFYLAEFTQHHSRLVLERRAGVTPLLEVNAAILRGLHGGGM